MFRARTSLAVLVGFTLLAACQPQEPSSPAAQQAPSPSPSPLGNPAAAIAEGDRALRARQFGAAREAFTNALRIQPGNAYAAMGLAETSLALGDLASAEQLLAMVERSGNRGLRGRMEQGLGLAALQGNRYEEAKDHLSRSVSADSGLWRAWLGLGRAHAALDQTTAAMDAFAQAERTAPTVAAVRNDIGMFFLASKLPSQAIPLFEQALALDPSYTLARGNLRIARAMSGEYDAAVTGAAPAELADVLNNAGYAAVLNGDLDVADQLLRRALEVSPTHHRPASANLDLLAQVQRDHATQLARNRAASGTAVARVSTGGHVYAGATATGRPAAAWGNTPAAQQVPAVAGHASFRWQGGGAVAPVGPLPGVRAVFASARR